MQDNVDTVCKQPEDSSGVIALRVTIAALTFFLVQVFFAVHKYNRQMAAFLQAKADALVLVGDSDEARKRLSEEMVATLRDTMPSFPGGPRSPAQEAARVAETLGKRG